MTARKAAFVARIASVFVHWPNMGPASENESDLDGSEIPRRAFSQGVGTVFQFAGVMLFLAGMFVCCGSSLTGKQVAERQDLTQIGWGMTVDRTEPAHPVTHFAWSAQRAITVALAAVVFLGLALAGIGLGLQAEKRAAPWLALTVTTLASLFWLAELIFVVQKLPSIWLALIPCALLALFLALSGFAFHAAREVWRFPPPADNDVLPAGYEVPYSHLHQDSPDVRYAQELQERRQKLAVQQKELESLEEKLRRRRESGM